MDVRHTELFYHCSNTFYFKNNFKVIGRTYTDQCQCTKNTVYNKEKIAYSSKKENEFNMERTSVTYNLK